MTQCPFEGVGVLPLAPEQRLVAPSGELWGWGLDLGAVRMREKIRLDDL